MNRYDVLLKDKLINLGHIVDIIHNKGYELINEWQEKLGNKIVEMCVNYVENYNVLVGISQKGEETFYARRTPKDSELDVNKTIKEQFNLLRIADNEKYPTFFIINDKKYILKIYKDIE